MANKNRGKKEAISAALLSMVVLQGGASIAKAMLPVLGAVGTNTLRLGFAGIMLAATNRPKIGRFRRTEWFYSIAYGICTGLMNLFFYLGIECVPLGLGVTVEFIGPLGLALVTSKRPLDFLWAILAATGLLLIAPWGGSEISGSTTTAGGIDPLGLLYVFIAGLLWAGYIIIAGKATQKMKGSDAITVGMCIATLLILPAALACGALAALDLKLLLAGLGVALFSSAIPYSLDLVALKRMPAKTFSILQSLQPALAALSGLIFLSEILSLTQWLAIACVVAASVGSTAKTGSRENNK